MKRAAVLGIVALLAAASPSRAQVAVVTAIQDDDVTQRTLAATVVSAASARWQMLSPQLTGAAIGQCKPDDSPCLRLLAKDAGASHLLIVSVVPIGVRNRVVAVQLFAVNAAAVVFEGSAVQPGGHNVPEETQGLAEQLVEVPGPPAARSPALPSDSAPAVSSSFQLGPVLLLGGVVALGLSSFAFPVAQTSPESAQTVALAGSITGVGLATLGAGLMIFDSL